MEAGKKWEENEKNIQRNAIEECKKPPSESVPTMCKFSLETLLVFS